MDMKKTLWILILLFLLAGKSVAQTTAVSATVTDSDGIAWNNLTFVITFQPLPGYSGQYTYQGTPFIPQQYSGNANSSGTMSITIPDSSFIFPTGTKWQFVLQPYASAQSTQFTMPVTGATQDFTVLFSAGVKAPRFAATAGSFGYSTVEVSPTPQPGGQFFNVTLGCMETWNGLTSSFSCNAGGGANPAGNNGDVQTKNGSNLNASGCNDNGTQFNCNRDPHFQGPNLGVDVTRFGVQAINHNVIPSPTATITATTNSATVSANTGLAIGNGFVIVGAGPVQNMTTPTAPTVTPSCASSSTGMGYTVPVPGGSTSYAYSLIMLDAGYGYTAASTNGTTSTGNATLGARLTTITSIAVTTGTNTFTATVNSTAELAAGCAVLIEGTTDDAEFGGYKIIASIVDTTHFTYISGVNQLYGMSATTATGGNAHYWLCNHIVMPTPGAGGVQYGMYGRTAGSMAFLGMSLIANLGYTDSAYNTFDDYGSPMMDTPPTMWWMPSTPPSSPVNDMLITFITNISGTTLTLDPTTGTAGTSVTSAPARFDNTAPFLAAQTSSNTTSTGGGGTLRLPPVLNNSGTGVDCYVFSSPLIVTAKAVIQDGQVCPGATIKLTNGAIWQGTLMDSVRLAQAGNGLQYHIPIAIQGANPAFWVANGHMNSVVFIASANGGVELFNTASSGTQTFFDMGFQSVGSGDYMTVGFYDYHGSVGGAFGWNMDRITCSTGPNQIIGSSTTPCFASKFNTLMNVRGYSGDRRGIYIAPHSSGLSGSFQMGQEIQGLTTPMFAFQGAYAGNVSGSFKIVNPFQDTSAGCVICNFSPVGMSLGAMISIDGTNLPGSNAPVISGQPFGGTINVFNSSMTNLSQIGQNTNVNIFGGNNGWNPGIHATSIAQSTASYSSSHTLNAKEGAVIATATLTFTVDCTLGDGTAWDIYSQSGVTTIAASAGCTLYGANSTGPYQLQNGSGVHITLKGTTANSSGGPGGGTGCPPGGSTNALQSNGGGGCAFQGLNAPIVPGDYIVHYPTPTTSSVPPARDLAGVPINPQSGTTYTEGTANYQCDRGFLVTAGNAGAQTYTMVNPTTACFGQNYFSLLDVLAAGAVTENASGFTVNGGTSFTTPASWLRWLWSNGVNYTAEAVPTARAFPACLDTGGNHYNKDANGNIICGTSASGNGLSGMTAGQVPIAASATSVTSSEALAGAGAAITTGPASSTSLDVAEFTGTGGQIADAGFLASNVWRKDAANVSAAVNHDFSAGTWKWPAGAGATASATSNSILDTTNKNEHCYMNNADAICLGIPSAPTTGDIFDSVVLSGNVLAHDSGIATANVVTAASAAAAANQPCFSGGANKTCVYADLGQPLYAPAANNVNGTAGIAWDCPNATPVAIIRTGTTNNKGSALLSPWGASDSCFIQFHIPADADLTTSLPTLMLELTSTDTTNLHTIIMQESVECAKLDGSTTDDVAFNAARSFSTINLNGNANRTWQSNITLNSTDLTGCSAPGLIWVKISRTTDTATNVGVYGMTFQTFRRPLVQAN